MTQVDPTERCTVRSLLSGEQMIGTAGQAPRGYLLVEDPGPWGPKAFAAGALDGHGPAIAAAAEDAGLKPLVIRPTGRRDRAPAVRRVFVALLGAGRVTVSFEVGDLAEITTIDLSLDAPRLAASRPEATTLAHPLLLVCTHAKRDQCCAIHGVPLAADLAADHPGEVFECSHLSGHRFAATALALPSGAVYGRLTPASARRALAAEREGRVVAEDLRGLSALPPAAQVADAAVRMRLGLAQLDDVRVLDVAPGPEDRHDVTLAAAGRTWRAEIAAGHTPAKPPSCGKRDEESHTYRLADLRKLA